MFKVRNIIKNITGGMSQVTVDSETFNAVKSSTFAVRNKQTPELAVEVCRNKAGLIYNSFTIDGVNVLYRYNSNPTNGGTKHEFYMSTEEANKRLETMASIMKAIDLDPTQDVGGYVTAQPVA
jgi:hypothetical protein